MTKREEARLKRLLPNGAPRYVRIYDNGGESLDNYTAVFTGRYTQRTGGEFQYLAMNSAPFHPQGIGQHGGAPYPIDAPNSKWPPAVGRRGHLGKRIQFEDLPAGCQRAVMQDYCELWNIPMPEMSPPSVSVLS